MEYFQLQSRMEFSHLLKNKKELKGIMQRKITHKEKDRSWVNSPMCTLSRYKTDE